jgi:hypothetical protein
MFDKILLVRGVVIDYEKLESIFSRVYDCKHDFVYFAACSKTHGLDLVTWSEDSPLHHKKYVLGWILKLDSEDIQELKEEVGVFEEEVEFSKDDSKILYRLEGFGIQCDLQTFMIPK